MCIIVHRSANETVPLEVLESCQRQNHDGWGIMAAVDGRVQTVNGMTLDAFKKAYETFPVSQELAVHFRWKTHGAINLENTHPYEIFNIDKGDSQDLWVMHNGVISISQVGAPNMSDTWHWINKVLKPLLKKAPDALNDDAIKDILEYTVDGSRLLFLDNNGKYTYLNPEKWVSKYNCKFSTTPPSGIQYSSYSGVYDSDYYEYAERYFNQGGQKYIAPEHRKNGHNVTYYNLKNGELEPANKGGTAGNLPVDSFFKRNEHLLLEYDPQEITEKVFEGMSYSEIKEIVEEFPEDIALFLQKTFS